MLGEVVAVGSFRTCIAFISLGDGRANVQSRFVFGTALLGVALRSRCAQRDGLMLRGIVKHARQ